MNKKWIKRLLWILPLVLYFGYSNLRANAVYYAKHMPHSANTQPEKVMLMRNLRQLWFSGLEGYEFDFDGTYAVKDTDQRMIISSSVEPDRFFALTNIDSYILILS